MKLVYKVLKGVQSLVLHCPRENIGSYQSSVLLRVYVGKQGPRGAVVRPLRRGLPRRVLAEGQIEQISLMKIEHAGQSNEQGMLGVARRGPHPA